MRIASWNIEHAAEPEKLRRIVSVLSAQTCDVVALQEVAESSLDRLSNLLEEVSLRHIAVHSHDIGWWLLTAARVPLTKLPTTRTSIERSEAAYPRRPRTRGNEDARVLSALLASGVVVHNVHVPPGSRVGWRKIDTIRAVGLAVAAANCTAVVACALLGMFRQLQLRWRRNHHRALPVPGPCSTAEKTCGGPCGARWLRRAVYVRPE